MGAPFRQELERFVSQIVTEGLPDDAYLPLAFVRLGDAIRAGIPVSREVFAAIEASRPVEPALEEAVAEATGWELAWLGPPLEPGLGEHLLRRRDEVASLVVLVRRAWMRSDRDPPAGLAQLSAVLRDVDGRMGGLVSPATVATALLDRALDDGWYRAFEGPAEVPSEATLEPGTPDGTGLGITAIGPSAMLAYIALGVGRAHVERWAEASAEATDDLAAAIDTALAAYEPVCFVGRLWRRAHGGKTTLLQVRPIALAAADAAVAGAEQHTLGSLGPVEAEGTLEVSGSALVLRVFPEHASAVDRVWLDEREASPPAAGEHWTVEVPRLPGRPKVRVRVEGAGHCIDEVLALEG